MTALQPHQIDTLREIQDAIGAGNRERGFHEEGERLKQFPVELAGIHIPEIVTKIINPLVSLFPSFRRNYYVAKLALIGSEVSEAIEELRHGHAVDETYYPSAPCIDGQGTVVNAFPDEAFKPEGVPSELADVVIRAFDFADEAGIDLASIISEKLTFNATRGQRHGGKEF